MEYPEDPWNSPDLHRNHNHGPELPRPNGHDRSASAGPLNGVGFGTSPQTTLPRRTTSTFTTSVPPSGTGSVAEAPTAWGYVDPNPPSAAEFNEPPPNPTAPFGGIAAGPVAQEPAGAQPPTPAINRTIGGGRNGTAVEEHVLVTLMPEKEGVFFFQHHNYEVTSSRRGSKVVRRYSDFVWLLDCLHKRYPFRILPLLPPKRVAGGFTLVQASMRSRLGLTRCSQRQPPIQ
jgi:sorting nexin-8